MIEKADAKQFPGFINSSCYHYIFSARSGISAGMIMKQYDSVGFLLNASINNSLGDTSALSIVPSETLHSPINLQRVFKKINFNISLVL